MTSDQIEKLTALMEGSELHFAEPMDKHTTFRIGGEAEAFVRVQSIEELSDLRAFCSREESMAQSVDRNPIPFPGKGKQCFSQR